MEYKVFISYSWANSAERSALEAVLLKNTSVSLLVDKRKIKYGDSIHSSILEMIDEADCVIVLLTNEGLNSHEVRDELTRCHERNKRIVPIVLKGVDYSLIPWYLKDINQIEYDRRNFDDVLIKVSNIISHLSKLPITTNVAFSARNSSGDNLSIVDVTANYSKSLDIDIKLRNSSPEVIFASRLRINTFEVHLFHNRQVMHPAPVKFSCEYTAKLPCNVGITEIPISQVVQPNDVDRILLKLVTEYPFPKGMVLFMFKISFIYNEDHKEVSTSNIIAEIPRANRHAMLRFGRATSIQMIEMISEAEKILGFLDANKELTIWPSYSVLYNRFYNALVEMRKESK